MTLNRSCRTGYAVALHVSRATLEQVPMKTMWLFSWKLLWSTELCLCSWKSQQGLVQHTTTSSHPKACQRQFSWIWNCPVQPARACQSHWFSFHLRFVSESLKLWNNIKLAKCFQLEALLRWWMSPSAKQTSWQRSDCSSPPTDLEKRGQSNVIFAWTPMLDRSCLGLSQGAVISPFYPKAAHTTQHNTFLKWCDLVNPETLNLCGSPYLHRKKFWGRKYCRRCVSKIIVDYPWLHLNKNTSWPFEIKYV